MYFERVTYKTKTFMNFRLITILLVAISFNVLHSQSLNYSTIDYALIDELENSGKTNFDIYIVLEDKVDVEKLDRQLTASRASPEVRSKVILSALQNKAATTQGDLIEEMKLNKNIVSQTIKPYWIANTIFFTANKEAIGKLSNDPRVQTVGLDGELKLTESIDEQPAMVEPNGVEPGLDAINVRPMWEMGYTGYGQLALVADTGIDPTHSAYAGRYRGNTNGDVEGWYSFQGQANSPFQCGDHGSHVLGTLLGLDLATQDTIGVAFDAQWMGSANLCSGGTQSNIGTFEWCVNPDGDIETSEDMADVVNNSWWDPSVSDSQCNSIYVDVLVAVEAAGVAVVFSAGNAGPDPETITAPKNISVNEVNTFTVAALSIRTGGVDIADFSSRGPSVCEGDGSLAIKPEVSAPGQSVRSVALENQYGIKSGTSMAAPHVSGSILVLKQAFPTATARELKLALYNSCRDLGVEGEDNTYGKGIIDVFAAYQYMITEGFLPVPAIGADSDVVALNIITDAIECDEVLTGEFVFLNNTTEILTNADISFSVDGELDESLSIAWTGSLAPRGVDTILLDGLSFPLGNHVIEAMISNPNGLVDERLLNNVVSKEILISDRTKIQSIEVEDQSTCGLGSQLVKVAFEGEGIVQWFDSQVGGNLLGEGTQFAINPNEANSSTIYGDILRSATVGQRPTDDITIESSIGEGLRFDVSSPLVISTFDFYSEDVGIFFIGVLNGRGDQVDTEIVRSDGSGWQIADVNIRLAQGVNYQLLYTDGGLGLGVTSDFDFPYTAARDENIQIVGNERGLPIEYKYFFNFGIEYLDFCGRVAVDISSVSADTRPVAFFQVNTNLVDFEENQEIVFTNEAEGATSFEWDFDDGESSSEENPTHTYTRPGVYFPSLIVGGESGCNDAYVVRVDVISNEVPLSTRDLVSENSFSLAPNPFLSRVNFTTSSPISVDDIKLFNSAGQLVKVYPVNNKITYQGLDISTLTSGLYYFVIQTENGIETHKAVKF